MRSLSKNVKTVNLDPQKYVLQGKKMKIRDRRKLICKVCQKMFIRGQKNENKGLQEINMRSLSNNVKKDSQDNVYQGSKKMKIRDRRK